jgi:hypothetical protein
MTLSKRLTQSDASPLRRPRAVGIATRVAAAWVLLAGCIVARAEEPPAVFPAAATGITIATPSGAGALVVNQNQAAWAHRLTARLNPVRPGATLQLLASDLLGPGGRAIVMTVSAAGQKGTTITVRPDPVGLVDIDLSAALPGAGEYVGRLAIRYGDAPALIVPIRIERAVGPALEVLGTPRFDSCWNCLRGARLQFTLVSVADLAQVTANLVDLTHGRRDRIAAQVAPREVRLQVDGEDARSFALQAGTPRGVTLDLVGLGSAGEYNGKVRFTSPGNEPKDVAFTLQVSDPWLFAGLLIALGGVVSLAIRRYFAETRPRSVVRQGIARLVKGLQQLRLQSRDLAADAPEHTVLDGLEQRLAGLQDEALNAERIDDAWSGRARIVLAEVGDRCNTFVRWANCRRAVASIGDATAPALREALDAIRKDLDGIQAALLDNGALAQAVRDTLAALPGRIEQARREKLESQQRRLAIRAAGEPVGPAAGAVVAPGVAFSVLLEDPSRLAAERRGTDAWVDWIALVIATGLGVTFVWSPSWGGWEDWFAAVLWGLGLHQLSGSTVNGVLGLRDRLARVTP